MARWIAALAALSAAPGHAQTVPPAAQQVMAAPAFAARASGPRHQCRRAQMERYGAGPWNERFAGLVSALVKFAGPQK